MTRPFPIFVLDCLRERKREGRAGFEASECSLPIIAVHGEVAWWEDIEGQHCALVLCLSGDLRGGTNTTWSGGGEWGKKRIGRGEERRGGEREEVCSKIDIAVIAELVYRSEIHYVG